MALDPMPAHVVDVREVVQRAPQGLVLDRLSVLGLPPVGDPALDPRADAPSQVGRVGVHVDRAGAVPPLEVGQRGNRRFQLHAVVGRLWFVALEDHLVVCVNEHGGPAAGAGVRVAATVGVHDHGRGGGLDGRVGKRGLLRAWGR